MGNANIERHTTYAPTGEVLFSDLIFSRYVEP